MLPSLGHPVSMVVVWGFIAVVVTLAGLVPLALRHAAANADVLKTGQSRLMVGVAIGLAMWLALTGTLAAGGFFARFDAIPPRFLLGVLPAMMAVVLLMSSRGSRAWLIAVPEAWLIAFQLFRVPVELVLFALSRSGVVPVAMTFEGRNFDILTGLTAPLVVYLCLVRGSLPRWVAVLWNALGLGLLVNVVRIAVLAAPGPFRQLTQDAPNLVPFVFPFSWLPYFLVPLALLGHLVSLNQLLRRTKPGRRSSSSPHDA